MRCAIVLLVAMMVLSPALVLAGERPPADAVDAASTVRSGKSNADNRAGAVDAASTVKSGKSNSDNRAGAGGTDNTGDSERGTTVKSSKSNTND